MVIQLVDAILSCNRHGIAHRDIKLSNITFPIIQKQDVQKNVGNNYNKNERERERERGKEKEIIVPGMKKSLSATFLPFQDHLRKIDNQNNGNESEPDFNFDYSVCSDDYDNNNDNNDNDIEMKMGMGSMDCDIERERDEKSESKRERGKNENWSDGEREEEEKKDEDIFIKLADFGMAGFIGRDGRLRGRCGTPGTYV